jgi:hypothetical protein
MRGGVAIQGDHPISIYLRIAFPARLRYVFGDDAISNLD